MPPFRSYASLSLLCAVGIVAACGSAPPPSPSVTPRPTAAPTAVPPTATPSPSATPTPASTLAPSPTPFSPPRIVTSDDGLLTVDIPAGALADSVAMTATAQGKADLPLELIGLEVRSAFYSLEPAGVSFAAPVTITRRVSFEDLGLDRESDGVPILTLAIREGLGQWEWLDSQTLTTDGDMVVVSGEAATTGMVFAFGGKAFTKGAPLDADLLLVGQTATVSASLVFPDDAADPPSLGTSFEPVVAGDFVTIGAAIPPEDGTLSQEFRCVSAGTGFVGVSYLVLNIGADSVLFGQLGLAPVSTEVTVGTLLTCTAVTTPAPASPARAPASPM